jgi:GNAT superfamily N-acetyltransferase
VAGWLTSGDSPQQAYAFYQMAASTQPDKQEHASASGLASAIRPARFDELAPLTQLALRSKAVWGYAEQFMAACREELTLTKGDLGELFVKEVDSQVVGLYSLQHLSATHVELGYLFVEPAQLRRGHGKDLILDAVRRGAAAGYTTLVIQGDPHAVDFYVAVGAKQIGTRESDSVPGRFLPLFALDLKQSWPP